ncbi:low-density lipoprotein receptor-related protein 4-like [Homalodisca vitripennis]|uniref:low-density lipoprotein receptor-related protein 4-like n=1 Tax=Homalodisca vitripennis TaxID=197043 RepID=UPI001EEAEC9B|nr:low-density lipoprotein receptor-related protein 4-like [Homalodisca vitripennis]
MGACGGLSVDWIQEHIYWIDEEWGNIVMATLDGSHQRVVYTNDTLISGIAVDAVRKHIFWLEGMQVRKRPPLFSLEIKIAHLCGIKMKTVISSMTWPSRHFGKNFFLDVPEGKIYFLQRPGELAVSDYRGKEKESVKILLPVPVSFSVTRNVFFWLNEVGDVFARSKEGGKIFQILSLCQNCTIQDRKALLDTNFHLRAIDERMQPKMEYQYWVLTECLLNYTTSTDFCPCPFGYKTGQKNDTCEEDGIFLASYESAIQMISTKGEKMTLNFKKHGKFPDLDFHYEKKLLIWIDSEEGRIYKAPIFNLSDQSTVSLQVRGSQGVAVDWIYNNVYWSNNNAQGGCVEVCRLDGSARQQILYRNPFSQLMSIALDPIAGLMYISNWTGGSIEVSGMDGLNLKNLVRGLYSPQSLTLDFHRSSRTRYEARQLFWVETRDEAIIIKTCYLKNKLSCRKLYSPPQRIVTTAMTLFNNRIYWADRHTIQSIRQDGIGRPKKIRVSSRHMIPHSLRMYHSKAQPPGENLCHWGKCPYQSLCLPSASEYTNQFTRCVRRNAYHQTYGNYFRGV